MFENIAKDGVPKTVSNLARRVIRERGMGSKLASRIPNHKSREGVKRSSPTVISRQHLAHHTVTKLLMTNSNSRGRDRGVSRVPPDVAGCQTNMLKHVAQPRSHHTTKGRESSKDYSALSGERPRDAKKGYSTLLAG